MRPHRWQPIRLHRPWDSPGKNAGVGCHFLLQSMKVKSQSEVAQSCPTLRDLMDCSLPGTSLHGIFQARVLEWGAIAFSETYPTTSQFLFSVSSQWELKHMFTQRLKNFFSSKDIIKRKKRQGTEWEKKIIKHISDMSRIYMEILTN